MRKPLISVIIPIFNMEQYLPRCLDSVLNNTYRDLEILCIDDGSKDGSLKILREYEQQDNRIAVISKANGGVSSARNAGLDHMTGEYVTFIDPHDFVHPRYVELLLNAALESSAGIACCSFRLVEDRDLPKAFRQVFAFTPVCIRHPVHLDRHPGRHLHRGGQRLGLGQPGRFRLAELGRGKNPRRGHVHPLPAVRAAAP